MTVVNFPDEIHRIIFSKLDQDPRLEIYLAALEKCIQRDLDLEHLIHWWDINKSRITYDDAEHDFLKTIMRVQLGNLSWEEEKISRIEKHDLHLQDDFQKQQSDSSNFITEYFTALDDDEKRRHAWASKNPAYKSTLWMIEWLRLFQSIYKNTGPLEIIAKRFNDFFDKKVITDWPDTKNIYKPMSDKDFKYMPFRKASIYCLWKCCLSPSKKNCILD